MTSFSVYPSSFFSSASTTKSKALVATMRIAHDTAFELQASFSRSNEENQSTDASMLLGTASPSSSPSHPSSRRSFFEEGMLVSATTGLLLSSTLTSNANAAAAATPLASTVTDTIFLDIKGLTDETTGTPSTQRLEIGLFGKDAPDSTQKLLSLSSKQGLAAPCKPKEIRQLQREQLEANKVYNSCMESQDTIGVNYDFATIWRIIPGERIDVGAVSGKFVAREFPMWSEQSSSNTLKHDRPGLVSVRKGNDSGFGFTIYPGGAEPDVVKDLDENHIIVGQVLPESMAVLQKLEQVPVITSAKVNYMALTGGQKTRTAPSRSCRYGGEYICTVPECCNGCVVLRCFVSRGRGTTTDIIHNLKQFHYHYLLLTLAPFLVAISSLGSDLYCNENKPLVKLTILNTGKI